MSYRVVSHNHIDRSKWQKYVDEHPRGTVYHMPCFFDIFSSSEKYKPFVYFTLDENHSIKAIMSGFIQIVKKGILSSFSTRTVFLQSPIYSSLMSLRLLMDFYLTNVDKSSIFSEIRNHWIDEEGKKIYLAKGFIYEKHLNYLVDCRNKEVAWKAISESKRRQIKKGLKNGSKIIHQPNLDQFMQFISILNNLYKRKIRKPLPDLKFFKTIYHLSKNSPEKMILLLVGLHDLIIGGIICPLSYDKTIHEFYIAGLDNEFKDNYPSTLATWAAIDYAIDNNIRNFDFMGAGKPDEDYSVREFKKRFGGKLVESGRYIYVHKPLKMKIAEKGYTIISKVKGTI